LMMVRIKSMDAGAPGAGSFVLSFSVGFAMALFLQSG
jgi:hypothetical protein